MPVSEPNYGGFAAQTFAHTTTLDMAGAGYAHVGVIAALWEAYNAWNSRQVANGAENPVRKSPMVQGNTSLLSQGFYDGTYSYIVSPSQPCVFSADALSSATPYDGCVLTVVSGDYTVGAGQTTVHSYFFPFVQLQNLDTGAALVGLIA